MKKRFIIMMAVFCMVVSMTTNVWAIENTASQVTTMNRSTKNLALNKKAIANEFETGTSFTADKAVDGNASTRWATNADYNSKKNPKWLQIDFGETTTFDMVDIAWEQQNILAFEIQVSDDANTWTTVYQRTGTPASKFDSAIFDTPAIGRYVRVYITDFNGDWPSVSIFEVAVYNTQSEDPDVTEGNYQIYPTPQKMTDTDEVVRITSEINVIAEDGIDEVTRQRIDEVFQEHGYTTVYTETEDAALMNLYIGIHDSEGAADTYPDIPHDVFQEAENKYDMHVVSVLEKGDIVILGKDSDAAYYGLASLEQMLDQSVDQELKLTTIEDYAFQKYRGAVEGYYGYPWSVEGTLSWMEYAKRYKMNVFLYGPKSDPYHLGKWDEDYPLEVTEEDYHNGIRTQDQMRQYAQKATECKVDFVWVAHPAMQKPLDFTDETTMEEGIERLMSKFDHMYQLGVREFGIFVDDISDAMAAQTSDMQIYMLNEVQNRLYEKYNTTDAAVQDQVKPLFFTPAWYTTGSNGAAANLPKFKNVHPDIEICFTGNNVFSSISNTSATTFKNWIGRTPVMWWNYPVNDAEDSVFFTNPIDFDYSQDPNPTNIKGVIANPMNFSEASKVAFFGVADYTWNPQTFDAKQNWNDAFDAIIPEDADMANALRIVYGNLNDDYIPMDVQRVISNYNSENKETAKKIKNKMYEIMQAVEKLETLGDSENAVYRLLLEEAQTSIHKLYDMAAAIGGAMAVVSSNDPIEQVHGYHMAQKANERLQIIRNPRYKMISLEGAGVDIYNSVLQARPSDKCLKPFVSTAMRAIENIDITSFDTSDATIEELRIMPYENVEAKQGSETAFEAFVVANREEASDVIWSVENAQGETTKISKNGILYVDTNELSSNIVVKAVSAYDKKMIDEVDVKVTDRKYEDPTIPVNLAIDATILGASGRPSAGEGPENLFDDSDTTKWCPGNNSNNNQWAAFDLGSVKQLTNWQVVGGGIEHPLYIPLHYSLQVLKDSNPSAADLENASYLSNNANWEIVAEYRNNKDNITSFNFDTPVEGRYFRMFIENASQPGAPYPATRIFESRVFGVDKAIVSRTHSLLLDSAIQHGSLEVDAAHYEEGAKVNIAIRPEAGYQLKVGSLKYNDQMIDGTYFLMPSEDVVLTAEFEPIATEETSVMREVLNNAIVKTKAAQSSPQWNALAPKVKSMIELALHEAQAVYANTHATNAMYMQAWLKLANALQYFDFKADKIALQAFIAECTAIDRDMYTEDSLFALDEAIKRAEAVNLDENVLQESIDHAYTALEKAKAGLVVKGEVQKAALTMMLEMIQNHIGEGSAYKKDTHWELFIKAMDDAKAVLADATATQSHVNQAMYALSSAYENIRLIPDEAQLAKLQYFLQRVKQMNRSLFTQEECMQIDTLFEDSKQMLADFDSKVYTSISSRIDAMIALMDAKQNVSIEIPKQTISSNAEVNVQNASGSTRPKTGVVDDRGSLFTIMMISAVALYVIRKKDRE